MAITLFSCGNKNVTSYDELVSYIGDEEHALSVTKKINTVEIQVAYQPTDLLVSRDISGSITNEQLTTLRSQYADHYYFLVSFSRNKREIIDPSSEAFTELLNTISFRMSQHVRLSTPTHTIPVSDFLYTRTFQHSKKTSLLFVFSKAKIREGDELNFEIDEFGLGVGRQGFSFNARDLNTAPKIDSRIFL